MYMDMNSPGAFKAKVIDLDSGRSIGYCQWCDTDGGLCEVYDSDLFHKTGRMELKLLKGNFKIDM